jgi:hypothetical protein
VHLIPSKICRRIKFKIPLGHVKDPQFLSAGAVGYVYRTNWCIAVKIPAAEGQEDFIHENAILDELDGEPRCAEIVQSFLRFAQNNQDESGSQRQYEPERRGVIVNGVTLDEHLYRHLYQNFDTEFNEENRTSNVGNWPANEQYM